MRENLLFLEFEFADEAERVLNLGEKSFRGRSFHLEKWKPSVGCLKEDNGDTRLVWVKILGFPLHLWGRSLFKRFGDSCGRFVAVDENTTERRNLKWARILIETRDWHHPSSLQVVAGSSCFALQLWWEEEPRISTVLPSHGLDAWKRKDDEVPHSRAEGSVGFPPSSSALPQPEKLPPQPEKLSPPVLGKDDASDKSKSTAHQALACDLDLGLASSSDLGLGTPTCSPRRRRGPPAESPQLEAPSHLEVTSANDLPPTAEGRKLQGMLLPPPSPLEWDAFFSFFYSILGYGIREGKGMLWIDGSDVKRD
ncbi:hypothetical protein CK203_047959 [Vitis vinifera]|uniref:Uncharacterized protein n=1 Tax=Vitis vinifera TaxID=29760 RepID=A0A438GH36_VITVI|nr:hypothetical protein CK203_047959 [Vitis vinifera]